MFQEKSAEEPVCNASLIRNVWEIRTKSHTQKLNTEEERVKKSALQQINKEWQNRMLMKKKGPPRLERKTRHSENTELQNYLNKPSLSHMKDTHTEISNSKLHNQRGLLSKKFINDIYQSQPSLQTWGKSWKFSRPKLHVEEERQAEIVSDWGKSWKFLNPQPKLEDQPWSEQDSYNDDLDFQLHHGATLLSKEAKSNAFLSSEKDLCFLEWEQSWKFPKHPSHEKEPSSEKKQSNGSTYIKNHEGMCRSYGSMSSDNENEMAEWSKSWRVPKPEEMDSQSVESELMEAKDHEGYRDKTSVSKWFESWMILYHELPRKKSQSYDWSESWKLLHVPSQQEKYSHIGQGLSDESSNFQAFERMLLPKENKINILLTAQVSESEWHESWKYLKPQSNPQSLPMENGAWLKAENFHHQNELLILEKDRGRKLLLSQLEKNSNSLKLWSNSWKLLKPQLSTKTKSGKGNSQDSSDLYTYIMSRRSKAKKILLASLEKEKLSPRKWGDAWKLAKTQPRQKRGSSKETMKEDKAHHGDWSKSWKFLYTHQTEEKSFMPEWEESWKYLLTHQQERGER